MKSWKIFIILLLLSYQSFSQQKVTKGYKVQLDTAIVMPPLLYRSIRNKLLSADDLIEGQKKEISSLKSQNQKADSLLFILEEKNQTLLNANIRKDTTIVNISKNFDRLYKEATEPDKWYERKELWGVAGLILGVVLSK